MGSLENLKDNMKVSIYELLGMVKDGKAPKEIKYNNEEYKITKVLLEDNNWYFNYINEDMECIFPISTNHLNDEVEIIEEEKKIPEKSKTLQHSCNFDRHEEILYENQVDLANIISEILDYLKSKGE